jgi:hypothetical protein
MGSFRSTEELSWLAAEEETSDLIRRYVSVASDYCLEMGGPPIDDRFGRAFRVRGWIGEALGSLTHTRSGWQPVALTPHGYEAQLCRLIIDDLPRPRRKHLYQPAGVELNAAGFAGMRLGGNVLRSELPSFERLERSRESRRCARDSRRVRR